MKTKNFYKNKIGIIGLGYVGLPLAVAFSKKFDVVGFDVNKKKISNIIKRKNISEISKKDQKQLKQFKVTSDKKFLRNCNIYIVTVPTPIHENNKPDLRLLIKATTQVSNILKKGDLVIFESTVYPGTTEEICIPILEKNSKLKLNNNSKEFDKNTFFCGYSPERINPTDRTHLLPNTNKVVSGSSKKVKNFLKKKEKTIIKANIHSAPNIKVAEASKMIENVQRDLNIALINELSIIFNKLEIKTLDVLKAASTKWNFSTFYPGLVGGHCIGVDPYYMAHKAKLLKVKSDLILGGRRINDYMPTYVGKKFIKKLSLLKNKNQKKKKVLIMGITFKENCPDVRNSKVMEIYEFLKNKNLQLDLFDPVANQEEFKKLYKTKLIKNIRNNFYDGIIISVRHLNFVKLGFEKIKKYAKKDSIIFDLKSIFPKNSSDFSL